jgi:GTP-binding protein
VVDIRRGISELDEALIEMLNNSLPLHVLLTKADKLSRAAAASAVLAVEKQIDRDLHSASSLSVINRKGLQDLETRCRQWLEFY